MTLDTDELTVSIEVEGHDLDDQQRRVVDLYEQNVETFIRKNENYGGSFEHSAAIESILKHGEIVEDDMEDLVSRQIFVRGLLDKMSRFYQLQIEGEDDAVGEDVVDTLLDMGNYAIMLASLIEKYGDTEQESVMIGEGSLEE